MTIPVSNLNTASALTSQADISSVSAPREWGFMETLRGAMDQTDELQGVADTKVGAMLQGSGMDVHSAMIAVEKADLSFQLMMAVRNKIVAAYQQIAQLQF